ncbi:MAG: hypothetical protein QM723_08480 [Myxococcaceae bacterium]
MPHSRAVLLALVTASSAFAADPQGTTFPLLAKFSGTLYGFAELDGIYDSTEGFTDVAGHTMIPRADKYAGQHGRMTFSARDTRIGFKLNAPEWNGIKSSGVLEADFLGNQPPTASEAATFVNPTFRLRHAYLKLETPWVDVLAGQYWQLFGWQPYFVLGAAEIPGTVGEPFARAPQLRLSKHLAAGPVSFDWALAVSRSGQRDSAMPDGQAGVRLNLDGWKTVRTVGSCITSAEALSVGLSGLARKFDLPEFSAAPKKDVSANGWGYSVSLFAPIVRASLADRSNALSVTASFSRTAGAADYFTNLSGGVSSPTLPGTNGQVYAGNVDPGMALYDAKGHLSVIDWSSFSGGIQYYLPGNDQVWLALDYGHAASNNAGGHGAAATVVTQMNWASANVFWDLGPAVRFGAAYSWYGQRYADGAHAQNHRAQLTALYLF